MKITIETVVKAHPNKVWDAWNNPEDIKRWNAASDDWHTTQATVDLREGGRFSAQFRQEAGGVLVRETFEAETENPPELQRQGWQAILDKFAMHVEAKR